MKNKRVLLHILACIGVCGIILKLRDTNIYPSTVSGFSNGIIDATTGVIVAFHLTEKVELLKSIPPAILTSSIGLILALCGYGILKLMRRKITYGYSVIRDNFVDVVKKGLVVYTALTVLVGMFAYSIIGIPFAMLLCVVIIIVCIIGAVPVAINLGDTVQDVINGNDRRLEYNYIIGVIIMLFSVSVYGVGCAFFAFVFPTLALGTVFCCVERRFFCKPTVIYENSKKEDEFDRDKIKNIITKGLD